MSIGIVERFDLRRRTGAVLLGKQHAVVARRVERRAEVHEIDALIRDMLPQDGEVVGVEVVRIWYAVESRWTQFPATRT